MSWDSTPWFVGGGAQHSPEVARLIAHVGSSGAEGIVGSNSLKVTPLAVPGAAVRVAPGACIIANRYPGGSAQSYAGRNRAQHQVPIRATGSGGGRTDLIVARVRDPQYAGQQPADPLTYEYVRTEVVEGVSASIETAEEAIGSAPAIALAKVTLPASTGTVMPAYITDLRRVALPLRDDVFRIHQLTEYGDGVIPIASTDTVNGMTWPPVAPASWGKVFVPPWATRCRIVMTWAGAVYPPGNAWGGLWVQLGEDADPPRVWTQETGWDTMGLTQFTAATLTNAGDVAVPEAYRGTWQNFYPRANRQGGTEAQAARLMWSSAVILQAQFYEKAV